MNQVQWQVQVLAPAQAQGNPLEAKNQQAKPQQELASSNAQNVDKRNSLCKR